MIITNAKYYKGVGLDANKTMGVLATIDNQKLTVPIDESNRHYAEILKQVDAGTLTIADAD
tara:strand:+ start:274 stop:456 length:183 start_codon:yes stop_codon:yes gene_type:complete